MRRLTARHALGLATLNASRITLFAALAIFAVGCGATAASTDGNADRDAANSDARDATDATTVDAASEAGPTNCPCFEGAGDYCEADVAQQATAAGCVALAAQSTGHRLLSCDNNGVWTSTATCASGCETGESGASAACSLPVCDCFVSVSWCGASAARHGLTLSPPCRVPLVPEHDSDILGCNGNTWVVLEACANGCNEAPTGTPDSCISTRTPQDPGWGTCAHLPLLYPGLHPEASDRLRCAGVTASRISQTIGYATASAGYHAPDGTVDGLQYTAAVDLRITDLTETEIRALLTRLGENGFAAWYRKPGYDGWPSYDAPHIHAVFAGIIMKAELRGQVRDFLSGLNGLASHTTYHFWTAPSSILSIVRLLFSRHYTP